MKIHNVEPSSGEWLKLRLGIPTASMFAKILTPATQKFSKQARPYAFKLVAERLLNESFDSIENLEWVARGKELEPAAIKAFEFEQDVKTAPVGFITDDAMTMGATPDRLIVGESAALEIKCPSPGIHLEYVIDGFGPDYLPQVQGQAMIGEFEWVSRYSYHPLMPPALVKTYRDETYIANLRAALVQFIDMKNEILEKVRSLGYFEERRGILTAYDELVRQEMRD